LPPTAYVPLSVLGEGLSTAQITSILWARRRLSFIIFVVVIALTAAVLTFWPRTYTGEATLMVNYEVNDPQAGKDLPIGQVGSYISTQVELLQSPGVILETVDRLDLTRNSEYERGYSTSSGTLRDWVASKVKKNLSVYQGQLGSQLIYVAYSATKPEEAARVANTIVDVYREQDHLRSSEPVEDRARRYAQQLEDLKNKVDEAQLAVTAFHQRNGAVEEGKSSVDLSLLANLEGRLVEAQTSLRLAQARVESNAAVSDPVLASNHVQNLKTQIATLEIRLGQLKRMYTPNYPDIREVQAQLADSRRLLTELVMNYSANATAAVRSAQRLEATLTAAVEEQRTRMLAQVRLRDEAAKHMLELEAAQAVYKRALNTYDQFLLARLRPHNNVGLVSQATVPVKASRPKVLYGALAGFMAAAVLSLSLPMLLEFVGRRVRCRDDLERPHSIPVLAEFGRLPMRSIA
jgi:uncharacterized protein involved in exopolysaccharide biosynthesis